MRDAGRSQTKRSRRSIDDSRSSTRTRRRPATLDAVVRYNLDRAAILEQIAPSRQGDRAGQLGQANRRLLQHRRPEQPARTRSPTKLVELRDRSPRPKPGSPLAGYVAFREMSADYAAKIADAKAAKLAKIQDAWRDKLKKFVEKLPDGRGRAGRPHPTRHGQRVLEQGNRGEELVRDAGQEAPEAPAGRQRPAALRPPQFRWSGRSS